MAWLSEQGESERDQMVVTLSELLCPEPWAAVCPLPQKGPTGQQGVLSTRHPWAAACSMRSAHKERGRRDVSASLGFTVLFFLVPPALLLYVLHDYTHFISCSGKVFNVHTDAVQSVLEF